MGAMFSDIKDVEADKKDGLKTFAAILEPRKLFVLLWLFIMLALLPIFAGVYARLLPNYALMLVLVIPYNFLMFKASQKKNVNTSFLYSVAFDSQLIWWFVFVLFGKVIF